MGTRLAGDATTNANKKFASLNKLTIVAGTAGSVKIKNFWGLICCIKVIYLVWTVFNALLDIPAVPPTLKFDSILFFTRIYQFAHIGPGYLFDLSKTLGTAK